MKDDAKSFDKLPENVSTLLVKIERMEKILGNLSDLNHDEPNDELLTIDQASKFTSLAKQTIYGYVSNRQIPFIKRAGSKRLYFSKPELREWLTAGRKSTMKPSFVKKAYRR